MKKYTIPILLIILVIIAIAIVLLNRQPTAPTKSENPFTKEELTIIPEEPAPTNPNIVVTFPNPNTVISSPLLITGQAVGPWYFEASFPIKLYDGNNTLIAQTTGQAQGNWMTTSFVPFTATLTFTTPSTPTGTLILEKDNPSGEPQNADSISIPVTF